jgi:predicted nucleic acid-binding protein
VQVAWAPVFEGALRMSAAYSRRLGTRSLDLLHVAAACLLNPKEFITSDQRQAELAKREGLKVVLIT